MRINISADDLQLMRQVQADLEPVLAWLLKDHRLDWAHLHVTYGLSVIDAHHKDGTSARIPLSTGMLRTTNARTLADFLVRTLLEKMGKAPPPQIAGGRQVLGDIWLPG